MTGLIDRLDWARLFKAIELRPKTNENIFGSLASLALLLLIIAPVPLGLFAVEAYKWPVFVAVVVLAQAAVRFDAVRAALADRLDTAGCIFVAGGTAYMVAQAGHSFVQFPGDVDLLAFAKPLIFAAIVCWVALIPEMMRTPSNPLRAMGRPALQFTAMVVALLIAASQLIAICLQFVMPSELVSSMLFSTRQFNRSTEAVAVGLFLVPLLWKLSVPGMAALVGCAWGLSFFALGIVHGQSSIGHVHSETVLLVLPIGFVVYLLAGVAPRLVMQLVSWGTAIGLALAPWLFQWAFAIATAVGGLPFKLMVRLEISDAVSRNVLDAPVFGHGLNYLRLSRELDMPGPIVLTPPTHPHNAFLQLWQDAGAIGVGIGLVGIFCLARHALRLPEAAIPPLAAFWTALVLALCVTHGLWQSWWMAAVSALVFAAALAATLSKPQ